MFRTKKSLSSIFSPIFLISGIFMNAIAADISQPMKEIDERQPHVIWNGFYNHPELQKELLCFDCINNVQDELRSQTGFSVQGNPQLNVFNYFSIDTLKIIPNLSFLPPTMDERGLIDTTVTSFKEPQKLCILVHEKAKDSLENVSLEALNRVAKFLETEKLISQPADTLLEEIRRRQTMIDNNHKAVSNLIVYLESKGLLKEKAFYYLDEINQGHQACIEITGSQAINHTLQIISYFDCVVDGVLEDIVRYSPAIYDSSAVFTNEEKSEWSCKTDGLISPLTFIYREIPTLQFHIFVKKENGDQTVEEEALSQFIDALKKESILQETCTASTSYFAPIIVKGQQKIRDTLKIFYDFKLIPDQVVDYIITHTVRLEDFRSH
jgi:hypothetical protein